MANALKPKPYDAKHDAPYDDLKRCSWCHDDELYRHYHDHEWGVPNVDSQKLFEMLILESMQAGLSWITILRRREGYRAAFMAFDAEKMAAFDATKVAQLLQDNRIIRNRLKIESAVSNAKAYLAIEAKQGFSDYLWQFVDHQPIQHHYQNHQDLPPQDAISEKMSKALKKAGFRFVGPTICYALMQATGMVNDHLVSCFRYEALNVHR
ncbi:MAG: DNA-3-methyladenine glycosylase I [Deinococcales bacterium]